MLRQRDYVRGQVRRLKRLNVMNDAFHIWTDEALPSINSCRIGRRTTLQAGKAEALGHDQTLGSILLL